MMANHNVHKDHLMNQGWRAHHQSNGGPMDSLIPGEILLLEVTDQEPRKAMPAPTFLGMMTLPRKSPHSEGGP